MTQIPITPELVRELAMSGAATPAEGRLRAVKPFDRQRKHIHQLTPLLRVNPLFD